MDRVVVFSESQKFNQWWLWLILIGLNGLFVFGIFNQIVAGGKFTSPLNITPGTRSIDFMSGNIALLENMEAGESGSDKMERPLIFQEIRGYRWNLRTVNDCSSEQISPKN
ncbi:hypothetical protein SAMN05421820_103668 [Pedobacter steynii]|uniref:Uncharacterized protein n=1 Tax=Pedobacter steynii TaxID=430522 RepID=A0A1G9SPM4_9SPHI|nr:hypothetical protein SAMN05421820_103668 [Pedobacter steynii]